MPARRLIWVVIMITALNLRLPITSVGPILDIIIADLGLSRPTAALLLTLPLLTFALASFYSADLSVRFGFERVLATACLAIFMGILLRSAGGESLLLLGTVVVGLGIAAVNAILPGLVRREFNGHAARVIATYAFVMGISATIASMAMVPLEQSLASGWRGALAIWAPFALAAFLPWMLVRRRAPPAPGVASQPIRLARSPVSWALGAFMGINSFCYYALNAWLPTYLHELSFSFDAAGNLHALLQFTTILPGLVFFVFQFKPPQIQWLSHLLTVMCILSLAGMALAPGAIVIFIAVYGFATGACLIIAMMMFSTLASSPQEAARISGFVQSLGYGIAATGPIIFGWLGDVAHSWSVAISVCAVLSVAQLQATIVIRRFADRLSIDHRESCG
ncbi:CP family cyanate transporter-like MFS transporter [Aquamicrobium terrae]